MKQGFYFDCIDDYGVIRLTTKRNSTYLINIDESNWTRLITLKLSEEQKDYVASPMGILARVYVYRCDVDMLEYKELIRDCLGKSSQTIKGSYYSYNMQNQSYLHFKLSVDSFD